MDDGVTCNLWWPEELTFLEPDKGILLFGWCFSSDIDSINIVVATGLLDDMIFHYDIEESLCNINKKLSVSLRKFSSVTFLGHCGSAYAGEKSETSHQQKNMFLVASNERPCFLETREDVMSKVTSDGNLNLKYVVSSNEQKVVDHSRCSCGYFKLNSHFENHRKSLIQNGSWIQLISESPEFPSQRARSIPKLHHLHQNGQQICVRHLHVIIYKCPTPGNHHLSLNAWNSRTQTQTSFGVPYWLGELQKKKSTFDLETVILSLNSSNVVKKGTKGCLLTRGCNSIPTKSIFNSLFWHILAISVASISTIICIIVHVFARFLVCGALSYLFTMFAKLFQHAASNVHVRCSQLQYWPTFLHGTGSSFQPNVEYAHKTVLRRHAFWTTIVVDVLSGSIVGLLVLTHVESICSLVFNVAGNITNNLLRSGCVWLMGVPAGFKLNTELAELLGMMSLSAIQIWSTFWFFMGVAFGYVVSIFALCGILLGLTVAAALWIDMLKLVTMHISSIHMLISFLYSQQIQALTSLWRLFRGQKWNPLRQRLDSFDYTVEEHVVGSLLFTPILLLLPTTTAFYIFFTIMNLIVDSSCIIIEIMISILHVTPYTELFLWILRRGRFPSGVWFEIVSSQEKNILLNTRVSANCLTSSDRRFLRIQRESSKSSRTIYVLHSNFANIEEILMPPFRKVFDGFSLSSIKAYLYKILSGQRTSGTLRTYLPPTMPSINLSFIEYWRLCHASVIGCSS